MAEFVIDTDSGHFVLHTDPVRLNGPDGEPVSLSRFAYQYVQGADTDNDCPAFSPELPIIGKEQPRILKIQLGLGCNYSCAYCSQGGQKAEATASSDVPEFLESLQSWLTKPPEKIEFWGGEPLLYWKKIVGLIPTLRQAFPDASFSIVTNGSLLTAEKAAWLYENGFTMAVSHDGPGQKLRGEDPFESPEWTEMIRGVFRLFGDRVCFNSVITPLNYRLLENLFWFEQRMGFECKINIEDIVTDYGGMRWTESQLAEMEQEIYKAVSSGVAFLFPRLRWSVNQLLQALAISKPLAGSHQVCGMDRKDQLAVDLHGNVLTCQNAGVESGHKIGHVDDLNEVKLNTAKSWAARPNCHKCPVVHLCYGSCMFLEGKEFESSCETSFRYNRAILMAAVKLLTGAEVRSISGWKPDRKPAFPIPVVGESNVTG